MRRSDTGRCPRCDHDLQFGVKEETASWKVYFGCAASDCTWEFFAGRIRRSEIEHVDEVYERAEGFHERI